MPTATEPLERCRAVAFCPGAAVARYQVTTTYQTGVPVACCGFHRVLMREHCDRFGWEIAFVEIEAALPN